MKLNNIIKWLIYSFIIVVSTPLFAQYSQDNDSLFLLLKHEVGQNFESFSKKNNNAYYLSYRVEEINTHKIYSEFGYILNKTNEKQSFLYIELRVGNPETDNFHYNNQQFCHQHRVNLPLEFNSELMKEIIATETEKAYAEAVLQFARNEAASFLFSKNQQSFYFNFLDADEFYQSSSHFDFDDDYWTDQVKNYTAELSPFLSSARADFIYTHKKDCFVNSERRYIVENHDYTYVDFYLESVAGDGTLHHISDRYYANLPIDIPPKDIVNQRCRALEEKLFQNLQAENVQPSKYPVLLSPKVSALLIHNTIGHAADKNDTVFFQSISDLNNSVSVFSDPTSLKLYNSKSLIGSYFFDYEGVKSENVSIIEKGKFRNVLCGRTQTGNNIHSNAHNRAVVAQSNLTTEYDNGLSHNELVTELKKYLKKYGFEFGLYFENADINCNRNEIVTIAPTVCYKIFADNRPDELVRNVLIKESSNILINNILLGGDSLGCVAVICNKENQNLPVHSCAPELLIVNVNCYKAENRQSSVEQTVYPESNLETEDNIAETFFKAAEEQHEKNLEELRTDTENAPYYSEFLMTDAKKIEVSASCGSLLSSSETKINAVSPRFLMGSDIFNNENYFDGNPQKTEIYQLPDELNAQNISNYLSKISKKEYVKVLSQWKSKKTITNIDKKRLNDRNSAIKENELVEKTLNIPSLTDFEDKVKALSELLQTESGINNSAVEIISYDGYAYFKNSEKYQYSKPISVTCVIFKSSIKSKNGKTIEHKKTKYYQNAELLFNTTIKNNKFTGILEEEIEEFAVECKDMIESEQMNNFYFGPVLIKDEAVAQIVKKSLFEGNDNILSQRVPLFASDLFNEDFIINNLENQIEQKIFNKNITVSANMHNDDIKTDAECVKTEEFDIVKNGELLRLAGDLVPTNSSKFSNGGRQIAITDSGFVSVQGVKSLIFRHDKKVPENKLEAQLIKLAQKKGFKYAYIIERLDPNSSEIDKMYRIDVKTRKKTAISGAEISSTDIFTLNNIVASSKNTIVESEIIKNEKKDTKSYEGVPLSIQVPEMLLFETLSIKRADKTRFKADF